MNTNCGLQVIFDLTGCRCDSETLLLESVVRSRISELIDSAGLQLVRDALHQFTEGGVTAAFLLAESHLTIHTWPETRVVSFDLYASNYSRDNTETVRALALALVVLFSPTAIQSRQIARGVASFSEPLTEDKVLCVRAIRLLAQIDSPFQRIEVYNTSAFGKVLRLDGYSQLSDKDEFIYHETLVHPAMLAHSNPSSVLIIGGGDGGAAEEVLKHPSIERVVVVEIDKSVVDICTSYFSEMQNSVFEDTRVSTVFEDGWDFVQKEQTQFDVVLLDLSDAIGRAERLYSDEFLAMCGRLLNQNGIVVLHVGSPNSTPENVSRMIEIASNRFQSTAPYLVFAPLFADVICFVACSDTLDLCREGGAEVDTKLTQRGLTDLRVYDGSFHDSMFAIPKHLRRVLAPLPRTSEMRTQSEQGLSTPQNTAPTMITD